MIKRYIGYMTSQFALPVMKVLVIGFIAVILGCNTDAPASGSEDIQIYFSPEDKCDEKIVALLNAAAQELNIAVYSFNKLNIAEAVAAAHKRGITVRVITDAGQAAAASSKDEYLEQYGIPVIRVAHPGYGAMHNKFAVIDSRIVITGSYNWTSNATTNNDENLAVITSKNTAKRYNKEFEKIWSENSGIR